ncbi:uncharacterized protein [Setaria viridis]|nr:uncharacterized protein LOC117860060 isoform X2 [Setaria viridis]TKW09435.1 hypothetical protein SEVIR_6G094400v2 [Setaria viridis]
MYFSATLTPVLFGLLNEWAVQILVLFSFTLQVFLLLFAWIRRHKVSPVPRVLLWIAYQLADSTALFTLGHLSISSRLQEHELVAFWAPLLLVHLGGQDTITAYSIEDNGIWLRHLQTLIVQVSGAAYVIYKYIPGSETLIIAAAVLIFIVGVLKYAERIWALKCASMDSIWLSLDTEASTTNIGKDALFDELLVRRHCLDAEDILMAAHGLLDVCKGLFIGLRGVQRPYLGQVVQSFNLCGHLDKLMEMELSLMYDIMYTKAVVIHTRYGFCIRIIAPVATVAALVLFQISNKDGHSSHDVAISYILLVGAVVLEIASLVRAVGSTWTRVWLYDKTKQASPSGSDVRNGRPYHWLHDELVAFRRLVRAGRNRRWSGSIGQFNLLLSCAQATGDKPASKLSAAARSLGLGHIRDLWGKLQNSRSLSVQVSGSIKELVLSEVLRIAGKDHGVAGPFPGLVTLEDFQVTGLIGWSVRDIGFEDSIIAWHIASEICMFKDRSKKDKLLDAIEVLSNYMMFLLVERPYMLPGPVRRSTHERVHDALCGVMGTANGAEHKAGPEKRVEWALRMGLRSIVNKFDDPAEYDNGVRLADMLYHRSSRLEVIFGVWVEMLCFVAHHCSRESHARQLSSGGELVTIVWLMASHGNQSYSSTAFDSNISNV